jgi:hypothetical protein
MAFISAGYFVSGKALQRPIAGLTNQRLMRPTVRVVGE